VIWAIMFWPLRFLLGGLLMQRPVLLLDAFESGA
jgi:hypothetical protein